MMVNVQFALIWLDDMNFSNIENGELQKRYKGDILPQKTSKEVIDLLRKKYNIDCVDYHVIDLPTQKTIPQFGESNFMPSKVFLVEKNANSEILYQRMEHDFGEDVAVLICLFGDDLSSNCSALDLEMSILCGVSFEDCQKESSNYFFYLSQMQMFGVVMGKEWHDFYHEQPYYCKDSSSEDR